MRVLKALTALVSATSLVVLATATPASAVTLFRCQMALYDVAEGGRDSNCRYTAGGLEGLAIVTVESGAVDLYIDCTVGGVIVSNIRTSRQISYSNVGHCFAAIFPVSSQTPTFAVVDVGSLMPV